MGGRRINEFDAVGLGVVPCHVHRIDLQGVFLSRQREIRIIPGQEIVCRLRLCPCPII